MRILCSFINYSPAYRALAIYALESGVQCGPGRPGGRLWLPRVRGPRPPSIATVSLRQTQTHTDPTISGRVTVNLVRVSVCRPDGSTEYPYGPFFDVQADVPAAGNLQVTCMASYRLGTVPNTYRSELPYRVTAVIQVQLKIRNAAAGSVGPEVAPVRLPPV